MHSPYLGRFIQEDPIGFAAGLTNVYTAFNGNPTTNLDPLGLEVAGKAHMNPLYLGGSHDQPVFDLSKEQHTRMHDYL